MSLDRARQIQRERYSLRLHLRKENPRPCAIRRPSRQMPRMRRPRESPTPVLTEHGSWQAQAGEHPIRTTLAEVRIERKADRKKGSLFPPSPPHHNKDFPQ